MLQIPNHPSNNSVLNYDKLLAAYLPINYLAVVPIAQQQEKLQQFNKEIKNERFYFSIHIKDKTIANCQGINRWLGYDDNDFSIKNYEEVIHPAHAFTQGFYAAAIFAMLTEAEILLQFMQPVFATLIALKHKKGHYLYCKRECFPFQLSAENKLTECLCTFNILKGFTGENYHTRMYNNNNQYGSINKKILATVNKLFEATNIFSVQELRILRRYAQSENTTSETIAKAFKIEKSTVGTYNKRIMKKAETITGQRFDNAKKVAGYLSSVLLI